jgi:hypothetical protein
MQERCGGNNKGTLGPGSQERAKVTIDCSVAHYPAWFELPLVFGQEIERGV